MRRKPPSTRLTRRQILMALAALGITGPAATRLAGQARRRLSVDQLGAATAVLDQDFDAERLTVIRTALQRNLDQFQLVRDLEIDDLVEPAPIFHARGK